VTETGIVCLASPGRNIYGPYGSSYPGCSIWQPAWSLVEKEDEEELMHQTFNTSMWMMEDW
jgi:hypothetical protein